MKKIIRTLLAVLALFFITSCVGYGMYDEEIDLNSVDGAYILEGGRYGSTAYYIDGNYILEGGRYGSTAYYIDGNYILEGGRYGSTAYYIDK